MDKRFTQNYIDALKQNIKAKKLWIAETSTINHLSEDEMSSIRNRLHKIENLSRVCFDMADVCRSLDLYNGHLQSIVWELCSKFSLKTPDCNYFNYKE